MGRVRRGGGHRRDSPRAGARGQLLRHHAGLPLRRLRCAVRSLAGDDARMSAANQTLGFVGLGHMGGNMAARLLGAGYTVFGEARSRGSAERLIQDGLTWCDTPRELAADVEIVF